MQPIDQLWFDEYEASQRKSNGEPKSKHYGRSRSARKIDLKIEEAAEAEGEGSAAAAAAAALQAREEGRRLDHLTLGSIEALREAVAVYKDVCLTLKERAEILEGTHIEMLQTVRGYYLHAMQAEGALLSKESEGDPSTAMLIALVAKHLGIEVPAGTAAVAAAAARGKRRPPPNGVAPA